MNSITSDVFIIPTLMDVRCLRYTYVCLIIVICNYSGLNIFMWMQFIRYMHSFGHENTVGASIEARKRPSVNMIFKVMLRQSSCFAQIFYKEIIVTVVCQFLHKKFKHNVF